MNSLVKTSCGRYNEEISIRISVKLGTVNENATGGLKYEAGKLRKNINLKIFQSGKTSRSIFIQISESKKK